MLSLSQSSLDRLSLLNRSLSWTDDRVALFNHTAGSKIGERITVNSLPSG